MVACLCLAACVVPAGRAAALEPDEVAVVANAQSEESVALARLYLKVRNIPADRLVLVHTTKSYHVSRDKYNTQIAEPLRTVLRERGLADDIRAVCLMWHVPVRVGKANLPRVHAAKAIYAKEAEKARYRLAIAAELLDEVGRKFPEPKTDGIEPLGDLFPGARTTPDPLPELGKLLGKLQRTLQAKHATITKIADPAKQKIAWRQYLAVLKEVQGVRGVLLHIKKHDPPIDLKRRPLLDRLKAAGETLREVKASKLSGETAKTLSDALGEVGGAATAGANAHRQTQQLKRFSWADASVDSELALLWWGDYEPAGARPNLLHWRHAAKAAGKDVPRTLMTARIDGPTPEIARRLINDAVAAEKSGLTGTFYLDAGCERSKKYDGHLKKLAGFVRRRVDGERINVHLDTAKPVLKPDSAPNAALYVGWYSLRKYVSAFTWRQGAVGWHIASFEAKHLRDPDSNEWCVKMLQNGVAATLGAVDEPYLHGFPMPQEFFGLLLTGRYTLAECYWRTVPMTSWRMTLIGDPLYTPFAGRGLLRESDLPDGLAPAD
ncbi:MAG: TIGR03790 family protein [Phycisphaerae bacterium]|nr:TIGR03790 family protein [Phycisphaerae bacterium]